MLKYIAFYALIDRVAPSFASFLGSKPGGGGAPQMSIA